MVSQATKLYCVVMPILTQSNPSVSGKKAPPPRRAPPPRFINGKQTKQETPTSFMGIICNSPYPATATPLTYTGYGFGFNGQSFVDVDMASPISLTNGVYIFDFNIGGWRSWPLQEAPAPVPVPALVHATCWAASEAAVWCALAASALG
jgi:hypothetical protein